MIRTFRILALLSIAVLTAAKIYASDPSASLTPLPADRERQVLSLNGKWMFNQRPEKNFWRSTLTDGWNAVRVPAPWSHYGATVGGGDSAGYRRNFFVPERWRGQLVKLRCDGVDGRCSIWVNGRLAGEHSGLSPFEYDVTRIVNPGTINEIAVSVAPAANSKSGGITNDISLFAVPKIHLTGMKLATVEARGNHAVLRIKTAVKNGTKQALTGGELRYRLTDADGNVKATGSKPTGNVGAGAETTVTVDLPVNDASLWSPENPALYRLDCSLDTHSVSAVTGLRTAAAEDGKAVINGEPVKLKGVILDNLTETSDLERLLAGLRASNLNFIGMRWQRPDERMLSLCDSLGLLFMSYLTDSADCGFHPSLLPSASGLKVSFSSMPANDADDAAVRNTWGESLDQSWQSAYRNPVSAGLVLDCHDRTLDEQDLWNLRKSFSPVRITLMENIRPDGTAKLNVSSLRDRGSLSDFKFRWEAGDARGEMTIDWPPGESADVSLALPPEALKAERMTVAVTDADSREIDRYEFPLHTDTQRINSEEKNQGSVTFLEKSDAYLVTDGTVTFSVSKTNGLLSVNKGAKSIIYGPWLTLTGTDKPVSAASWVARKITAEPTKDCVTVTAEGNYGNAEGRYVYKFTPGNRVEVSADFRLLEDEAAEGAGILFTSERKFDTESWERNAHWNCYPAGHPGAAEGTASSDSPAFRASKIDFRRVTLKEGDNISLDILGNGRSDFSIRLRPNLARLMITNKCPDGGILRKGTVIGTDVTLVFN